MKSNNSFIKNIWDKISHLWKKEINIYFVSGMCYNCKVFDKLELPKGYKKIYIEWLIPLVGESLEKYSKRMAQTIDTKHPFILVGYSFGAVIVQEISRLSPPSKCIIISSIKQEKERPTLFKVARSTQALERIPMRVYSSSETISRFFNKFICDATPSELSDYMTVIDPVYVKWAAIQITNWIPASVIPHLYHIHGTKDPIFTYSQLEDVFPVTDGDHLMVVRKSKEVSSLLCTILNKKE